MSKYCEGHPERWNIIQHRWDTNQLICCTCGKELKPTSCEFRDKGPSPVKIVETDIVTIKIDLDV